MKLVLMGDFHYPALKELEKESKVIEIRDLYYKRVIEEFLNIEGDYHISLGDLTNYGEKEEFKYVCNSLKTNKANFIHVIGNHDSYMSSKDEITKATGQKRYFSEEKEDMKLIFIDSTLETNYDSWIGDIDKEQLNWLEEEIKAADGKLVMIFSHHPVYNTTALSTEKNLYIRQIDEVNRILSTHKGKGIFFCGHNHKNSIVEKDNWIYVQTGAVLDLNAFRVVEIDKEKVNFKYKELENITIRESSKIIGNNMNHFFLKEDAEGAIKDKECIHWVK